MNEGRFSKSQKGHIALRAVLIIRKDRGCGRIEIGHSKESNSKFFHLPIARHSSGPIGGKRNCAMILRREMAPRKHLDEVQQLDQITLGGQFSIVSIVQLPIYFEKLTVQSTVLLVDFSARGKFPREKFSSPSSFPN